MIELSILKLFCSSRDIEFKNYGFIKSINNLEKELKLLYSLANSYYKEYEDAKSINKDEFLSYFDLKCPKSRSKDICTRLIHDVFNLDINEDLLFGHLDNLIEKHHATAIINKLLPVMEGDKYGQLTDVRTDIDNYIDLLSNPPDDIVMPEHCSLGVADLIEQEIEDEGLSWHLPLLNTIIGGARPGTFGLIYAYVDSGKTSFALSSCTGFAKQLAGTKERICYCGNEEKAARLKLRSLQSFFNLTRTQIKERKNELDPLLEDIGFNNVYFFDNIITGEQIQYIIKEYKPSILFIDQATDVEINTTRKREGTEYLKALFKWYRKVTTKENISTIGVAQGVGTAENTKWLKLSDIYGSRVAIQGSLDYTIGVGRIIDDPTEEDLRFLNIPKNKLLDGDGGQITVEFIKQICRWKEL